MQALAQGRGAWSGPGLVDEPTAIAFARALGQTSDRLVSWHTEALVEYLAGAEGTGPEETLERLAELLDDLEELLLYAWRRHLAATVRPAVRAPPGRRSSPPPRH